MNNYFSRNSFAGTNAERAAFTPLMDYAYFYETDTEDFYIWSGAAWHGPLGGAGGGPFVRTGVVDTITVTHIFQARIDLNDGTENAFISGGNDALTGIDNVGLGEDALLALTSGDSNAAVGWEAMKNTTEGDNNTAVGAEALLANTTGDDNVAVGFEAMYSNTTGFGNVAVGEYALGTNSTGDGNTAIGLNAMSSNKDGDMNTVVGEDALSRNEYGVENTVVGVAAQSYSNAYSDEITAFADYSGTVAGTVKVTSPGHGLPVGTTANVCIYKTTNYNQVSPGITVTYIDANNFYFTHAWAGNDATGYWMVHNTGGFNTTVGGEAAVELTRGSWNVFLGFQAGSDGSQVADVNESVAIGYLSYTTKDQQVVLGNPNDRTVETQLAGIVGINLGSALPAPAAQLDILQDEAAGAIPVLELDQDDQDESFINFVGTSAADQTKSISTVNGDGSVTGPKNFSATAGWEFVGMVKVEVNGSDYWMPYYQPDTS